MRKNGYIQVRWFCPAILATVLLLMTPTIALAWRGWPHLNLTSDAARFMSPDQRQELGLWIPGSYPYISRDAELPVLPELDKPTEWWFQGDPGTDHDPKMETKPNWYWVAWNGMKEDDYEIVNWGAEDWGVDWQDQVASPDLWLDVTVTHFWDPFDVSIVWGTGILSPAEGTLGEPHPNAWMKAKILWQYALSLWAEGNEASAYSCLGRVVHLVEDMGNPAHAHEDWHPIDTADDSLEAWLSDADDGGAVFLDMLYSYTGQYWDDDFQSYRWSGLREPPGGIMFPPSNQYILAVANDPTRGAIGQPDPDLWTYESSNLPQLFYLMYTVNRYGNFSPSDVVDGDGFDPTGWADFNDPLILRTNANGQALTGSGSTAALEDNDSPNNNDDGDFTRILQVGWRAAYRATPAVIDLFRKTVDHVAPITAYTATRVDGKDLVEWNNSPVTVSLVSAEDGANAGYRASDVWKRWGLCNGEEPNFAPDETPYWALNVDGSYQIQLMSTDWVGNVEGDDNDFTIKVDLTPPELSFPNLRPNYLTSESVFLTWLATDEMSGIDSEVAYLDSQLVPKNGVIGLALMAGKHRLEVYAYDKAQNFRYEYFDFEVWIDTETDANPIKLQTKTDGKGMFVLVQFPAPYDVGAIDVTSCMLRVEGTIDLEQEFPVVGDNTTITGELLTGVGDHNDDGIPDRTIRFDKTQFAQAVAGQTGDVPAVVWGGLLPDGTPRFLGNVTVPVFTSPK